MDIFPNGCVLVVFFPPDVFPQPDLTDEGLARPVLAGIVATICFLAAAILFSTLAACFVNKQRKRKLKRKKGEPVPGVLPLSQPPSRRLLVSPPWLCCGGNLLPCLSLLGPCASSGEALTSSLGCA